MRAAHLLDPMLRPPEQSLRHRVLDVCRDEQASKCRGACALRQYQDEVAHVIAAAYDK
jgi:hypothetical protein